MKIAVLAPPYLPVPPPLYGGTEKIVSLLTEGLVRRGHDVTLFASGDSTTTATLSSIFPKALGNSGFAKGDKEKPMAHYQACFDRAGDFDIIHSHGQYMTLPFALKSPVPVVFTWHGSFYTEETTEEKRDMLRAHKNLNYISISNNQRQALPELNYVATVYNSINMDQYGFVKKNKGDYLVWIGRVSPKKGAIIAIQAAKKAGIRLEMAAAIDPIDRAYFDAEIKPHIDGNNVVYHGEIGQKALVELYSGALATLYPISWHEPFGLVMVESMATGTPVIAFNIGSVPEIIRDGLNGFVLDPSAGVDGFTNAIANVDKLNRDAVRESVEVQFHVERMVTDYERVYESVIAK